MAGFCQKELYSLFHKYYKGNAKVEEVISYIKNNCTVKENETDIANMLSVLDIESCTKEDVTERESFLKVLTEVSKSLKTEVLKERLEHDTLERLKLIGNSKAFNTKYVRTKTKLFYKQQKFNLLREENEGYNKLITELAAPTGDVPSTMENLLKLIGRFDLDPNRVLDLVLETWQNYTDNSDFFIDLVRMFPKKEGTLCSMLGFNFTFYQGTMEKIPRSLFTVAALLIRKGVVDLHELYNHLGPSYEALKAAYNKTQSDAREKAKELGKVALNTKEEEEGASEKVVEVEQEENQKVKLCIALIELGCWEEADDLIQLLPPFSVPSDKMGREALFDLISWRLHEFYKTLIPSAVKVRDIKEIKGDPQVQSWNEFAKLVLPLVNRLGCHLSASPLLFAKILRIFGKFVEDHKDSLVTSTIAGQIITITNDVLFPSLSLMTCNHNLSAMLWNFFQHFPYHVRYRLYGKWKNTSYTKTPQLIIAKAETIQHSRYIMKRLTKENVKPMGRQIGRVSHSNPCIIFDQILSQIQRYDNMILPICNALKYLGLMSFDMLSFCIIEALSDPDKEKLKQDDTNISFWFQILATFCGYVFKKYNIELHGLLQYIVNQLKADKSTDLLILKEVVQRMSGIEISEEVTQSQLEAVCGGPVLLAEAGFFTPIRHTERSNQRLQEALSHNNIWLPLCILASQQRHSIVFGGEERHIKLTARLYDQCQDTFTQLGQFLTTNPSTNQCLTALPSFEELSTVYHLRSDSAFFLLRTKLDKQIKEASGTVDVDEPQTYVDSTNTIMTTLSDQVKLMYQPKVWEKISPRLYATFWSLTASDIIVPTARYKAEIAKLEGLIKTVSENDELAQRRKDKEIERHTELLSKLKDEQKVQEDNCTLVMARLTAEKDNWFTSSSSKVDSIMQFLQVCIIQRSMFTASDAIYCSKFVELCHSMQASNFSTLIYFDRIFSDVSHIVTNCTDNEASRYGRFLCATLSGISRWHKDKALYEKECGKSPGFVHIIRGGDASSTDAQRIEKYLDYENFRHVCCKWHFKLTKAMVFCFDSKDYSQIRNGLSVLTKILPEFPVVLNLAQALEKRIVKVKEEEKASRPDLYALAMGYSAQLNGRKSTFINEEKFHHVEKKTETADSRGGSPKVDKKKIGKDKEAEDKKRRRDEELKKNGKEEKVPDEKKMRRSNSPSRLKVNGAKEETEDERRSKMRRK